MSSGTNSYCAIKHLKGVIKLIFRRDKQGLLAEIKKARESGPWGKGNQN